MTRAEAERFIEAIEASPRPAAILDRVQAIPNVRRIFSPLEILRIKQSLGIETAREDATDAYGLSSLIDRATENSDC